MTASQLVAAFALHTLWQIPLLAAAACLAVRVGRPGIRLSHALWVATLVLCVLVPVLCTWQSNEAFLARAEASVTLGGTAFDTGLQRGPLQHGPAWQRFLQRHATASHGLTPCIIALPPKVSFLFAVGYLVFLLVMLMRFLWSLTAARRLAAGAVDGVPQSVLDRLQHLSRAMRCSAPLAALSTDVAGPLLVGAIHPTLLLPVRFLGPLCDDEIDAVLAHELAHVRRNDPVAHAVCSALLLPVRFHPVAAWVAKRVQQTREMACDEEAARLLGSRTRYAEALLRVAEQLSTVNRGPVAAGLGLFDPAMPLTQRPRASRSHRLNGPVTGIELLGAQVSLEERVTTIFQQPAAWSGRTRVARGLASVAIAAAGIVAAWMVQVQPARAAQQSKPQTTSPAGVNRAPLPGRATRAQLRDSTQRRSDSPRDARTHQEPMLAEARGTQRAMLLEQKQQLEMHLHGYADTTREFAEQSRSLRLMTEQSPRTKAAEILLARNALPASRTGATNNVTSPKIPAADLQGCVLSKVQPIYPPQAKKAKIGGAVVLRAIIGENGSIEALTTISSPDKSLTQSSMDAVRQWKYKPYLRNGRATAVETNITVTYSFSG